MELEDNGIGDAIERRGSAELVLFQLRHHDSNFVIKIKMMKLNLQMEKLRYIIQLSHYIKNDEVDLLMR